MKLYQDSAYRIELQEESNILNFVWEEQHPEMTYEAFVEACCNFIGYGFEFNTKKILIDTRNFNYIPPEEFHIWQKTVHHDRYRKIGVSRVAYVMQPELVEYMKSSPIKEEGFETEYYPDQVQANQWLNH